MNRLGYAFLIVFTAARAETDFPTSELAESVYYSRDLASPPPRHRPSAWSTIFAPPRGRPIKPAPSN